MHTRLIPVFSAVAVLALFGAACGKKPTTTNTVVNTPSTNTATVTNSATTGSFTTDVNAATPKATVTISASGMSQKTITVSPGTAVTFVNNDNVSHQIASNPHPVHSDLPGFDGSMAPGQQYTFIFTTAGTWGYHDHDDENNTKFQGTVVVK